MGLIGLYLYEPIPKIYLSSHISLIGFVSLENPSKLGNH